MFIGIHSNGHCLVLGIYLKDTGLLKIGIKTLIIFVLITLLIPGLAMPDPFESENLDGTRIAKWDLSTPGNYTLSDTEINGGIATLSKTPEVWSMVNASDYTGGVPVNLSFDPDGSIFLGTTTEELLKNGDFTKDSVYDLADKELDRLATQLRKASNGDDDDNNGKKKKKKKKKKRIV